MKRFLLFDAGCAVCHQLTRTIKEAAGGKLEVMSIHERQAWEWLDRAYPTGWMKTALFAALVLLSLLLAGIFATSFPAHGATFQPKDDDYSSVLIYTETDPGVDGVQGITLQLYSGTPTPVATITARLPLVMRDYGGPGIPANEVVWQTTWEEYQPPEFIVNLDFEHTPPNGQYNGGTMTLTPDRDPNPWPEPIVDPQTGKKIGDETVATRMILVDDPLSSGRGVVLKTEIKELTGATEQYPDGSIQEVYRAYPSFHTGGNYLRHSDDELLLGLAHAGLYGTTIEGLTVYNDRMRVIRDGNGGTRVEVDVMIPDEEWIEEIQETRRGNKWVSLLSYFEKIGPNSVEDVRYAAGVNLRPRGDGRLTTGLYVPGHYWEDTVVNPVPFEPNRWNTVGLQVDANRVFSSWLNHELVSYAPDES